MSSETFEFLRLMRVFLLSYLPCNVKTSLNKKKKKLKIVEVGTLHFEMKPSEAFYDFFTKLQQFFIINGGVILFRSYY